MVPNLRAALEEALAANPDDLAAHAAYGDLLMEQGDPRGEFVQVQLALEDPACQGDRRRHLLHRYRMLMANERQWLGDLAQHLIETNIDPHRAHLGQLNQWHWERGWLDEVNFWRLRPEGAGALAAAPVARLLRRLGIGEGDLGGLEPAPFLRHLRYFRFGEEVDFEQGTYNCTAHAGDLSPLVALMPRLEELHLLARDLYLKKLFALPSLTALRTLVVYHERDVYSLDVLAENPAFASLETLRLHPGHAYDADGFLPFDEVAALFHSPHLSSLKHLHLHTSSMGDEGCEELVESGILERLETLDLRFGRITEAGVNTLLGSPHIGRLSYLSLANNQISDEGVAMLRDLDIPTVRCEDQGEEGCDFYLYSEDME